jgi:predicted HicB family RNase H-like nuclease
MKALTLKEFPDDLHREMKIQAAKQSITMKALIEKALREYLDKYGSKEHKKGR